MVISEISFNKAELVESNGCGTISNNDETAINFPLYIYIFPYMLQEDVESYVNQLTDYDPIFNTIYTSPVQTK